MPAVFRAQKPWRVLRFIKAARKMSLPAVSIVDGRRAQVIDRTIVGQNSRSDSVPSCRTCRWVIPQRRCKFNNAYRARDPPPRRWTRRRSFDSSCIYCGINVRCVASRTSFQLIFFVLLLLFCCFFFSIIIRGDLLEVIKFWCWCRPGRDLRSVFHFP